MRGVTSPEDLVKVTDDTFTEYLRRDEKIAAVREDLTELFLTQEVMAKAIRVHLPATVEYQGDTFLLEGKTSQDGRYFITVTNIRRVVKESV